VDLDLGQVRAFVAVADLGNATRAARELHLTQQALSKRLTRLEAMVGVLFERIPGGMTLTERGTTFLPSARSLLAAGEAAVAQARGAPQSPLRVDVWGEHQPMTALVKQFALSQPDLIVEYSMRRSLPQALTALERRELDIATGNVTGLVQPLAPALTAELMTHTTVAALVSERHPVADQPELEPEQLRASRLWWPLPGSSAELIEFVVEYAAWLDTTLVTEGRNTADYRSLVAAIQGDPTTITFVDRTWPIAPNDSIRIIPIRPAPCYPWYVVWPETAPHPAIPLLLRYLRRHGQLPDATPDTSWLPAKTRHRY
jgi:DNA-binding transcriptional LysR family regulator